MNVRAYGRTDVGAYGRTDVGAYGRTDVGAYGRTDVSSLCVELRMTCARQGQLYKTSEKSIELLAGWMAAATSRASTVS
jgi:hypothetical protein